MINCRTAFALVLALCLCAQSSAFQEAELGAAETSFIWFAGPFGNSAERYYLPTHLAIDSRVGYTLSKYSLVQEQGGGRVSQGGHFQFRTAEVRPADGEAGLPAPLAWKALEWWAPPLEESLFIEEQQPRFLNFYFHQRLPRQQLDFLWPQEDGDGPTAISRTRRLTCPTFGGQRAT